ncbi:hypothetical protein CDL12_19452 [Handroanthus impetiginosus]|uniref:Uncharacterized protein n=1 Tax=Handroanthus impetiginosus TaxID=429701 RepID=A0A2G9GRT2_9LAMI|nr:hypothetical protein CDL12_19452 [Handroanthus impetiginosus]
MKTKKMKMKKSGLISPRSQKLPPPLSLTQANYMKSTTGTDARKLSLAPARTNKCSPSAAILCENLDVKRATCSTTLKHCKFPGGTESNGTSDMKVSHIITVLSSVIVRSVKRVCPSPSPIGGDLSFDKKLQAEHTDFFIEIYNSKKENATDENHSKEVVETVQNGLLCYEIDSSESLERTGGRNATEIAEEVSSPSLAQEVDSESSDMDWEIGQNTPLYLGDDGYEYISQMEKKQDIIHGDFIIKLEILKDEVSQESFDEVSLKSDDMFSSSDDRESIHSYEVSLNNTKISVPVLIVDEPETAPDNENDFTKDQVLYQTSSADCHQVQTEDHLSDDFQTNSIPNQDNVVKSTSHESCEQVSFKVSELNSAGNHCPTQAEVKRKKPIKDSSKMVHFNPRGPNFLPVEPEPEAEKVDLRHWEPHERN